jgi:diaminopimelate decarboxylase
MDYFEYKNGVYHAEDVPLDKIAADIGTPFYCYSDATLTRHFNVFSEHLCFPSISRMSALKSAMR